MAHEEGARGTVGLGHNYEAERLSARLRRSDDTREDRHHRRANRSLARRQQELQPAAKEVSHAAAASTGPSSPANERTASDRPPQASLIRQRPPHQEHRQRMPRLERHPRPEPEVLKTDPFATTDFLKRVQSADESEAREARRDLCTLLSASEAGRSGLLRAAADAGVAPVLVACLNAARTDAEAQPLMSAMERFSAGGSACVMALVRADGVPALLRRLRSAEPAVFMSAAATLVNVAEESAECCVLCLQVGALQPILAALTPNISEGVVVAGAKALAALCADKVPFDWVAPALPTLTTLLFSALSVVLRSAATALAHITADAKNVAPVAECGVCLRLVELLMHPEHTLVLPCLETVSNICAVDFYAQCIVRVGFLPICHSLVCSPSASVRDEALSALSQLAARPTLIQPLIEANLFPHVILRMQARERGALWVLSNALISAANAEQVRYIHSLGATTALCNSLNSTAPPDELLAALRALRLLLRVYASPAEFAALVKEIAVCGGLVALEELQRHVNQEVYEKALCIIEIVSPEPDDGQVTPAPSDAVRP